MCPIDLPQPPGENRIAKDDAERKAAEDKFYKMLLDGPAQMKGVLAVLITDIGQVGSLRLPQHWQEGMTDTTEMSFFKEYHPVDAPDAKFCFFYRGGKVNQYEAAAFKKLLAEPPHELTAEEILSVKEVMRNKDDAKVFAKTSIRTEDLNGKRVLVAEGKFVEKQVPTKAVYVDADGKGSVVQEIYYQSPARTYPIYLRDVNDALTTLRWK